MFITTKTKKINYNIPIIFVIILLVMYRHFISFFKPIILKIPGNKSNRNGYIMLVKKLIKLSFIKVTCVFFSIFYKQHKILIHNTKRITKV